MFDRVIKAYTEKDREALEEAYAIAGEVDRITDRMEENHIIRLN